MNVKTYGIRNVLRSNKFDWTSQCFGGQCFFITIHLWVGSYVLPLFYMTMHFWVIYPVTPFWQGHMFKKWCLCLPCYAVKRAVAICCSLWSHNSHGNQFPWAYPRYTYNDHATYKTAVNVYNNAYVAFHSSANVFHENPLHREDNVWVGVANCLWTHKRVILVFIFWVAKQ